jgi:adenylate kinase
MNLQAAQTGPQRSPVWNIIIMGPQGSGKGTQADLLAEKYGLRHFEMGKLLRRAATEPTDVGRMLDRLINHEGKLAPFDIAMNAFRQEVERTPIETGIIFDGTPRRIEEITYWDVELPKLDRQFTHLIALHISEDETIERLSKRRTCSAEGTPFILGVDIKDDASPCPRCGAAVIQRHDDTPEVIRERLRTYTEQTEPVIARYRDRGIVREINGQQSIEQVFADIEAALRA